MQRPFYGVGLIYRLEDTAFLGTCFAFRSRQIFLTAAHCVGSATATEIGITLPLIDHGDFIPITSIRKHEKADIAVLRAESRKVIELEPFHGRSALRQWGEPVAALGYPEESEETGVVPTARLFTGSVQRFFSYQSPLKFTYRAGELSFGAPAGLSGGPVYPLAETHKVLGVVAENISSTTYLRSVEELQENGNTYRERIHHMIQYGIFVDLASVEDWVGEEFR